ncbi:MAG: hypothetical protein KBE04_14900 [Phycisphaerae bacterium]|nr:hypothetical protein [Phycisphaerae bacterium]
MNTWAIGQVDGLEDPGMVRVARVLGGCVSFFTVVGVAAAWLAAVVFAEGITTGLDAWGQTVWVENKTPIFYLLHGCALGSLLLAGGIGAVHGGYARLDTAGRWAVWVMVFSSLLWTLVAYDWGEILSPAVLGATGPFVWLSTFLLFAGMEPSVWPRLGRLLDVLVVATAVLAVRSACRSNSHSDAGVYVTNQYFCLLFWYGGWRCLSRDYRSQAWILADAGFLALLGVLALWLQRRSWIIDTVLLVGLYVASIPRRTGAGGRRHTTLLLAAAAIALPVLAITLLAAPVAGEALAGLQDRLRDDTRTEQYRMFFSQVSPADLVLGLGPKATYYFGPTRAEYQYFDNAYLWMAFIGGLPILVSYCVLIVRPGLAALLGRRGNHPHVLASGGLLCIWALVLAGLGVFSSPSLSAYSYFICLMAGLCHRGYATGDPDGVDPDGPWGQEA